MDGGSVIFMEVGNRGVVFSDGSLFNIVTGFTTNKDTILSKKELL